MSFKYRIPAVAIVAMSCGSAMAQTSWRVGDKVSVWVSADYYDGTVVEVGSGDHAGQYLIHFDKFTADQYALAKNVIARRPAVPQASNGKTGTNGCRIMVLNGQPVCDPGSVRRR
ncbi:MAG: hypothetical protein JSR79_13980 [Proteobacteria bacterium]|nr:hypothetical protein [Pseudomonadota bacterium]